MNIITHDLAEIVATCRKHYPANYALQLFFGDCVIEVRTSTSELKNCLASYFEEFLTLGKPRDILVTVHEAPVATFNGNFRIKKPDLGKIRIKETWLDLNNGRIVRKQLTGMHFVFGQGENVAVGPCLENVNQVVNFINNRFIEYKLNQGCLLGHAAGVALGNKGLALAGFSGLGKSTLALHLMSRGADFVSNDRVIVKGGPGKKLTMHGVAKHPRINPGTALNRPELAGIISPAERQRFLALSPGELWETEYKYDAIIAKCFGPGRFRLQVPLAGLVLLNWQRTGGGKLVMRQVNLAERADLLPTFMKATGLFYLPADSDKPKNQPPNEYVRLLTRCTVLEFTGGLDFEQAATACWNFLLRKKERERG